MDRIKLRPATESDYDFLWWLHQATMKAYVAETWGWNDAFQVEAFRRGFAPEQMQIIEYQGESVGYISVLREPARIFLGSIEMAPSHQRRGIGTHLIQGLCAEADAAEVPLELQVLKVNPAQHLYERLGFSTMGETETHFQMRRLPRGAV